MTRPLVGLGLAFVALAAEANPQAARRHHAQGDQLQDESQTIYGYQMSLKHVAPSDFEAMRASWAGTSQISVVLFCKASEGLCLRLERRLAGVATWIAGERRPFLVVMIDTAEWGGDCLLYTSPSPRDRTRSRMPSSA